MHNKVDNKMVNKVSANTWPLHGNTKEVNFIKSTLYKWLQLGEIPFSEYKLEQQMALLDDRVKILTPEGMVSGKTEFLEKFGLNEDWTAEYHLKEINVYPCGVGMFTAQSLCSYNRIYPNGTSEEYFFQIEADLKKKDNFNFSFLRLVIKETDGHYNKVENTYLQNRAYELIHYCMGLIEHNISDSKFFNPCFEGDFEIHPLHSKVIKNDADLIAWINEINTKIIKMSITPVNIRVTKLPDNQIDVKFDLLFTGRGSDGQNRNSLSSNHWILNNNINEPFARVRKIRVEKLEPIFI